MSAHSYWRVVSLGNTFGTYTELAEVVFASTVGGATLCTGGTPLCSGIVPGFPASYAFDGVPTTVWADYGATGWIGYHFASAVDPVEVRLTARIDGSGDWNAAPSSLRVDYSDDGTTWTSAGTYTASAWSAGQTQTFAVPEHSAIPSCSDARIIQSSTARGLSSFGSVTVTLPAAPAPGNTLLLIASGASQSPASVGWPPSGFALLGSHTSVPYQGIWAYTRSVVAADPAAWTFTTVYDWHNYTLLELVPSTVDFAALATTNTSSDISTGSLTAAPSDVLRLLVIETDNNAAIMTVPSGTTLVSGQTPSTGNHYGAVYSLAAGASGVQTFVVNRAPSNPVAADIHIVPSGPIIAPTAVDGTQVWAM
jgi:hypothetical protein